MIVVENVSKRFGPVTALAGVNLHVAQGEMLLLLGSNGAGKSTVLRAVLGIIDYEGAIRVDGLDPLANGREVRSRIGYVPQASALHRELTIEETFRFHAQLRGTSPDRAEALLREARLDPSGRARVGDLSGGMAQRLAFALSLLSDPPILLLDEPTASLDGESRDRLLERLEGLKSEGRTIIVSTHSRRGSFGAASRSVTVSEGRVVDASDAVACGKGDP